MGRIKFINQMFGVRTEWSYKMTHIPHISAEKLPIVVASRQDNSCACCLKSDNVITETINAWIGGKITISKCKACDVIWINH